MLVNPYLHERGWAVFPFAPMQKMRVKYSYNRADVVHGKYKLAIKERILCRQIQLPFRV